MRIITRFIAFSRVVCLLPLIAPLQFVAETPTYYAYSPQTVMSLGYGFSVEDLSKQKQRCVDFDLDTLDNGALGTLATIQMVSSATQLKKALGVDVAVDVSYLFFHGSSSFNYSEENLFREQDATLVLKFSTEYGRVGMKHQQLTKDAQALLTASQFTAFESMCGSQMVIVEHRGATVAAIVTLRNIDSAIKANYSGSLSGGMDLGFMSGSMSASLRGEMQQASQDGRLEIQVVSTGGNGFADLSSTVKAAAGSQANAFDKIVDALGDYIAKFSKDNAAPIGFSVGPMIGYAQAKENLWNVRKQVLLADIVEEYRHYDSVLNDFDSIVRHQDPRAELYSHDQIKQLEDLRKPLGQYLDALAVIHEACKAAQTTELVKCNQPATKPTVPTFYEPIIPPSNFVTLMVDGKLWTRGQARAVFGDPGGGSLLDRVRRRQPEAKQATRVIVIESNKILDVALRLGRGDPYDTQLKIFYPQALQGVTSEGQPSEMLTMGDDDGDLNLKSIGLAVAASEQCRDGVRYPNWGSSKLYVSVRDALGQITRIDIASYGFSGAAQLSEPPVIESNEISFFLYTKEPQMKFNLPLSDECTTPTMNFFQ
jgi:hypothetical protein